MQTFALLQLLSSHLFCHREDKSEPYDRRLMISCPRPKSLARSGLIATNFHLSFRKLFDNHYILSIICYFLRVIAVQATRTLQTVIVRFLLHHCTTPCWYFQGLLQVPPCQPNLDSAQCCQPSLYCGALSTDTLVCDRASTNSYTRELSLQESASLRSLTPFGRYPYPNCGVFRTVSAR